jgi:predicted metalloprotease with PDZ domain
MIHRHAIVHIRWFEVMSRLPAMLLAAGLAAAPLLARTAAAADYKRLGEVRREIVRQPRSEVIVGGGRIDIAFADGAAGLDREQVLAWVQRSAQAVSVYFGRFPVDRVSILIIAETGDRVGHATTWGYDGATIRIGVGREAKSAAFLDDWIMVHEMTHLALPGLPDAQQWALEGNATYVEPIARVQAGHLDAKTVWGDMVRGMPKGLPRASDRGLDRTHTWGRTYWGGALFYLLADVEIRQQTQNRLGLQHALRAINRASGGNGAEWTIDRFIEVGDRATGTDVLARIYARMREEPATVDLNAFFASLGVTVSGGIVQLDEEARLADIRRALMEPPAPVP